MQRLKKPNHYKVQALIMIQKNGWDEFHIWIINVWKEKSNKEDSIKKSCLDIWCINIRITVCLTAKIFLQELWRMKLGWDTIIDDNAKREWKKWQAELKNVCKVEIAWVHHPIGHKASDIKLYVFVMPQRRCMEL